MDRLTVLDFHANWCTPCKAISPVLDVLSKEYQQVLFLKCDVDKAKDVARRYSVSAMPTFVLFKGKREVDQVVGSDKKGLQEAIRKHADDNSLSYPQPNFGNGTRKFARPRRHSIKAEANECWRRFLSRISDMMKWDREAGYDLEKNQWCRWLSQCAQA